MNFCINVDLSHALALKTLNGILDQFNPGKALTHVGSQKYNVVVCKDVIFVMQRWANNQHKITEQLAILACCVNTQFANAIERSVSLPIWLQLDDILIERYFFPMLFNERLNLIFYLRELLVSIFHYLCCPPCGCSSPPPPPPPPPPLPACERPQTISFSAISATNSKPLSFG